MQTAKHQPTDKHLTDETSSILPAKVENNTLVVWYLHAFGTRSTWHLQLGNSSAGCCHEVTASSWIESELRFQGGKVDFDFRVHHSFKGSCWHIHSNDSNKTPQLRLLAVVTLQSFDASPVPSTIRANRAGHIFSLKPKQYPDALKHKGPLLNRAATCKRTSCCFQSFLK